MIKKIISGLILVIGVITSIIFYFNSDGMNNLQSETFKILAIICLGSILYCFIVGEISKNNSQMDKLWSILPEIYLWVMAIKSNMNPRLILMAIIATIWGIRLTINFAKKGAYSIKFWSGEEDYRWVILRKQKGFNIKLIWTLFDLLFISIYQNILVLLTTIPGLLIMSSNKKMNILDIVFAIIMLLCVLYESIADKQQMKFQTTKYKMLSEGYKLNELPYPYNKGFNTFGLWNISRHPNYFAEQSTWVSLYLFTISAGFMFFNWSIIGCLLLILLFMGSSAVQEKISGMKYPEYSLYIKKTSKYIPWKKYRKQ